MKYDNLVKEALRQLPSLKLQYKESVDLGTIDENDGPHIVFDQFFLPIIHKAIDEGNVALLRDFFLFVEGMEISNDPLIAEVVEFTILEDLCDNYADSKFEMYLGKETRAALRDIRMYIPESRNE